VENGTDYSTYLRIHDLLKLQIPLTDDAPDELLFIVVHQSYELWFKVIIDELQRSSAAECTPTNRGTRSRIYVA
jgi:tryptophan 2,3-dioxygenase